MVKFTQRVNGGWFSVDKDRESAVEDRCLSRKRPIEEVADAACLLRCDFFADVSGDVDLGRIKTAFDADEASTLKNGGLPLSRIDIS